jgi:hypothetical protein
MLMDLLNNDLSVLNIGLKGFASDLNAQGTAVSHVDWRPPAGGDPALMDALDALRGERLDKANRTAVEHLMAARPTLVGVGIARDIIPGMTDTSILHAGPPITWDRMCGPTRGAIMGALVYEGLAQDYDEAASIGASEEITFDPCHHHSTVGPMTGVVSPSMPVWIVENHAEGTGNRAFCTLNEGLGKVLRFGAYGDDIIAHLKWMEEVLGPGLTATMELAGPLDLGTIISQALQMGDECHNRNKAATSLLVRALAPSLAETDLPKSDIVRILRFIDSNDHFFLNISMPACKCATDAAHGIKRSSMVTSMSRNGTDFGVRVSGCDDAWFVAPAPEVKGLYFPGYSAKDANPDLGDSTITESAGIGGFAMAAAPAIVQFVGGVAEDSLRYTREMLTITLAQNPDHAIPSLDFAGSPTGIDVCKVVESGVAPFINTGIAHKEPGIGQVGAGIVRAPMECFHQALRHLAGRA